MSKIPNVTIKKTKYGTYALRYTNPDGHRRRLSVGKDYLLAQRQAVKFLDWLLEGKDPETEVEKYKREEKAKNITLRDFYPAETLLKELPASISDVVEFAIYSGFRKENTLSLKIENIRFHDLTASGEVVLKVKGGRGEWFPLCVQAIEVIKRTTGKRQEGFVFLNPKTGTRYQCIRKTFDRMFFLPDIGVSSCFYYGTPGRT